MVAVKASLVREEQNARLLPCSVQEAFSTTRFYLSWKSSAFLELSLIVENEAFLIPSLVSRSSLGTGVPNIPSTCIVQ